MQVNAVRNPEGLFINSSVFREEAAHFDKHGYYCPDPWGSPDWELYWTTQLDRCKNGYTVGGVNITGDHYFYLNFCKIEVAVEESANVARKEERFPAFYDGDYNYFHCLKIARYGLMLPDTTNSGLFVPDIDTLEKLHLEVKIDPAYLDGGYNMIVGKARRKGYSYKNGAICANTYNHTRGSLTIIGAFEKKSLYPEGTMGMASNYLNFLNQYTGWAKARDYKDVIDHKRASFKEKINGIDVEMGYKSDIMALTFMDNPDAARGKDARYVLLEEAGAFPNLEASYNATAPGLRAGRYATGQIIIFGTGGDMEKGTADFARMFYSPKGYKLMPFINIWDKAAQNTSCGFFHPFFLNNEGYFDEQGNSDKEKAIADEKKAQDEIRSEATGSKILQSRMQEYPSCPSEAFLTVSFNDFPVIELRNQLNKVKREKLHIKKGQPVHLYRDSPTPGSVTGKANYRPDLTHELEIIWDYEPKTDNLSGGVVMFEAPIENAPKGLYKIGFDPYRQVQGESLAAIYVYKGNQKFSYSRDTIVAQYVGRPQDPDTVNRIAVLLAEIYNTEVMHENEVTHVKAYFEKVKKLHLLAAQPDAVISKNIKNSRVARVYGIHMVEKLKDAGEKYIKTWLLTERDFDENGTKILNLETINDIGLLEELISYNRKGNFDRVMAFMQVMFQCEEEDLGKEYDPTKTNKSSQAEALKNYIDNLYKKSA